MLRLVDFWIKQRFRWGHFILCNLKISIVVQSLSCVRFSEIPWTAAYQASLSFSISWSLLKLMSTESMMPSIHFILCHSFLLLQSFPASGSFPMSQLFASGGQSIGVSASVLPTNKMDNVEEMDKFLEKYNFPKLNQEEIENLNRLITSMEMETVIRNLPTTTTTKKPRTSQVNSTKNLEKS